MSAITRIGIRVNLTGNAKKAQCMWLDHIYTGDGLVIHGDDGGGYMDFDDVFTEDEDTTNGWGMIRKVGGQYFMIGSLDFGDAAGTAGCKFQAKSSVLVFENRPVDDDLYAITVVDNGTGVTEFILGDKAGTAGIEGCLFRTESSSQTPKFSIDGGTDTDVDNFKLYGSTFLDGSTMKFPANAATVEVLNCNFEACDEVLATTCNIENCNFVSANDEAFILPSGDTHNLKDCNFINCADAWRIPTAGTYTCDGCLFINNTNDIDNTSGGAVTINKTSGSDPSTYTGSTTIQTKLTITITVQDAATDPIENVQTAVYKTSDRVQLMNEDTTALGVATEDYAGLVPIDVEIRCRKGSTGSTKYRNYSTLATLTGDFSLLVTLEEDLNNAT